LYDFKGNKFFWSNSLGVASDISLIVFQIGCLPDAFLFIDEGKEDAAGQEEERNGDDADSRCQSAYDAEIPQEQPCGSDEDGADDHGEFAEHVVEPEVLGRPAFRDDAGIEGARQRLNASLDESDHDGQDVEFILEGNE